jgi:L-fuculose-phosphate aldolase
MIRPKDYFGKKEFNSLPIYDPKSFDDWYDRASSEIPQYFLKQENSLMVVRGYGVYAFSRDLQTMTRKLSILEKSCRLLMLSETIREQELEF